MKNRILSLLAVLAIAVSMVGCTEQTAESAETTEQIIAETTTQELSSSEEKQALTFDEVNHIVINGVEVSLPFKVEDLGEGYTIGEVQGFNEKVPALFYDKQYLALIELDNTLNIISITFDYESELSSLIKVNDISFNNNFSEIIEIMGIPSIKKELALIYKYNNGEIYFGSASNSAGCDFIKISFYGGN